MNDIQVYRSALPKTECDFIVSKMRSIVPKPIGTKIEPTDIKDPLIDAWGKEFGKRILAEYLKDYPTESIENYTIHKLQYFYYNPGTACPVHVDSEYDYGNVRTIGMALYLNDDYEGGELYFPTKNFAVKPEAGTSVVFPVGYTHPHGSTPCSGERHAIVFFVYKTGDTTEDLYS